MISATSRRSRPVLRTSSSCGPTARRRGAPSRTARRARPAARTLTTRGSAQIDQYMAIAMAYDANFFDPSSKTKRRSLFHIVRKLRRICQPETLSLEPGKAPPTNRRRAVALQRRYPPPFWRSTHGVFHCTVFREGLADQVAQYLHPARRHDPDGSKTLNWNSIMGTSGTMAVRSAKEAAVTVSTSMVPRLNATILQVTKAFCVSISRWRGTFSALNSASTRWPHPVGSAEENEVLARKIGRRGSTTTPGSRIVQAWINGDWSGAAGRSQYPPSGAAGFPHLLQAFHEHLRTSGRLPRAGAGLPALGSGGGTGQTSATAS
jgi:hypothetical protein